MAETPTDVLVAGYQDIDEATKDFEALVALVKAKEVSIDGVILVTHAQDGSVSVRQTGDHLGRTGAGWGGGVGVAVCLFAPPLLASVAVGAVAGGVVGRFVDVTADLTTVTITCAGTVVGRHQRCWARHQTITDPAHVATARRLRQELASPPPVIVDDLARDLSDYDTAFGVVVNTDGQVA